MAHDLARKILTMAENDKNLEELSLKELYRKKKEQENEKLRKSLFAVIYNYIKNNSTTTKQMELTYIPSSSDIIGMNPDYRRLQETDTDFDESINKSQFAYKVIDA